ncbi:MAG: GNAT family N-acetyltransferase [Propionibacteriaceae bacterium]|jgi:GNAT superfamily N-acetyltransferase|nr:GNAT family N-acetyltransferase [Propionibacteriaceae bacterium]
MTDYAFATTPALACPYCGRRIDADTAWAARARDRWGWCGVTASSGGVVEGALLLTPTTSGNALLKALWVDAEHTGRGVGKHLVQTAAAGLLKRDVRYLCAQPATAAPSCECPPPGFLRRVGFEPMGRGPLHRLDLGGTVVEPNHIRATLERLLAGLRPLSPEAATRND